MRKALCFIIKAYQVALAPFVGGRCRFYPSCSVYGMESIQRHGSLKGSYLTIRRILKCNPWHKGGVDLVPESNCRNAVAKFQKGIK